MFSYRSILCHWNLSLINRLAVIVDDIVIDSPDVASPNLNDKKTDNDIEDANTVNYLAIIFQLGVICSICHEVAEIMVC